MEESAPRSSNGLSHKKLRRREVSGGLRFITFSCQRRLPLFRNARIAQIFVDALDGAREAHGFELFAWVVMPEHVHLLARPSHRVDFVPLDRSLLWMKLSVSKRVLPRWREMYAPILECVKDSRGKPRFWQKGGGFDRNVRNEGELMRTIRYIHHNPVERGLVDRPEQWQWSSVRWWMGQRDGELKCDPLPGDGWDRWLGFV